jgi:hypothetical protein
VPVEPDPAPGDLLGTALKRAEVGEVAGMTRQSAHETWYGDVHAWAAIGRSSLPPHPRTLEVAEPTVPEEHRTRSGRPPTRPAVTRAS